MSKQLLNYAPKILHEVEEYKALYAAEQIEIDGLHASQTDVLNNQFISTCTDGGAKRWENIIGITAKDTETLSDRRFRILSRLNEQLPYTQRILEQQLTTLCGVGGYSLSLANQTIKVRVVLTARNNFNDVEYLLERMRPANVVIDLSLLYNQNQMLTGRTHAKLSAYTHEQIRNEVV